jgi:hypothetical protein
MSIIRCVGQVAFLGLIGGVVASGEEPRLNQIQVIGTHNSYHIAPCESIMKMIATSLRGQAEALDYTHRPLPEQFSELGIRQVELDVFADPEGGLFAEPSFRKFLKLQGKNPGPDPNAMGQLNAPGFKILHVPDLDFRSTVPTFADALAQIRTWSLAHPRHVPILVLVELKDESNPLLLVRPLPFTAELLAAVDAAILDVFPREALLSPDDVRGDSETLPEAIRLRGWPTLESSRGKIIFALDNESAIRDRYLADHPASRGRVMFASVDRSHPSAAWMKVNDPVRDFERIQSLVRDGFLVRTRADGDTAQARHNDTSQRDKALSSGAQFISTDYPEPRVDFSPYRVRLPGNAVVRVNPVSGDASQHVEE